MKRLGHICIALVFVGLCSWLSAGGPSNLFQGVLRTDTGLPLSVDRSTSALVGIDYAHHEVHSGDHYSIDSTATLDSGASHTFAVTTPDTKKWAHMLFTISGQLKTTVTTFEGATVVGGTTVTPLNNNRNSANTSGLSVVFGAGIATTGTQIATYSAGSGTNPALARSGAAERDSELVLKQNTTYLFRITSGAAGNTISYHANWYEHTDKN